MVVKDAAMDNHDFPYHFDHNACKTCGGHCCRGRAGYVWTSAEELEKMAAAMKMAVPLFFKQYARRVQGRLSLRERVINGEHLCCFFDLSARRCAIYEVRPEQCRTFPFWDIFREEPRELFDECPGVSLRIDNIGSNG
ncbi:MAG: YkgJ family cysteine cluster protein [Desulfurivibrionaceae bacterium]|nr:YkgJ family cysteine cluster protein [Desulfurivibrionaceae bacterium]